MASTPINIYTVVQVSTSHNTNFDVFFVSLKFTTNYNQAKWKV